MDKRCGKTEPHQPHWWNNDTLWCDGKPPYVAAKPLPEGS